MSRCICKNSLCCTLEIFTLFLYLFILSFYSSIQILLTSALLLLKVNSDYLDPASLFSSEVASPSLLHHVYALYLPATTLEHLTSRILGKILSLPGGSGQLDPNMFPHERLIIVQGLQNCFATLVAIQQIPTSHLTGHTDISFAVKSKLRFSPGYPQEFHTNLFIYYISIYSQFIQLIGSYKAVVIVINNETLYYRGESELLILKLAL